MKFSAVTRFGEDLIDAAVGAFELTGNRRRRHAAVAQLEDPGFQRDQFGRDTDAFAAIFGCERIRGLEAEPPHHVLMRIAFDSWNPEPCAAELLDHARRAFEADEFDQGLARQILDGFFVSIRSLALARALRRLAARALRRLAATRRAR